MTTKLTFSAGQYDIGMGIEYEWCGGLGAWFKSHERGVRRGDVRFIRGALFHAYSVHHMNGMGQWLNPYKEVTWAPTTDDYSQNTPEAMRAFKAKVVGV